MSKINNIAMFAAFAAGALLASKVVRRKIQAYRFLNKVVLITGGSIGLGLIIAKQLAQEGAKVVICARDKEELVKAQHLLKEITDDVLAVPCDITDKNQINNMIALVKEHFGQIDVLINNAGTIAVGPMETMELEDYEKALKTHFWAPLNTILAIIPEMKDRGTGRIVNISSIGGKISIPHLLPYSVSKFALTGLSEGLRSELKKDGIVVTTVCPGLMRTGSPRNIDVKGQYEKEYAWFSILDSLPFTSMSVENAARKIIDACRYGDAELILTIPAKVGVAFHGLFPGITADLLELTNRMLPSAGGTSTTAKRKGYESESFFAPSVLTTLSDKAAFENNEA